MVVQRRWRHGRAAHRERSGTAADPLTVKFPASESENAEMPLVVVTVVKVGAVGSLGRITLGICLVVIPGPLISISYRPGAA